LLISNGILIFTPAALTGHFSRPWGLGLRALLLVSVPVVAYGSILKSRQY
jgi:hypothetical protein